MASSKVILGDCMEVMKGYPDKYFDLAICDPPYGINQPNMTMGSNPNRKSETRNGIKKIISHGGVSTAERLKGRLNSGSGKLKNRILNTSKINWDNNTPPLEYFDQLFRVSKNQIIWGGNYFNLPPTRGIGCWDKKQPWDNFSTWEMIWTSFDCPAFIIRHSNRGGNNVDDKIHPTQKDVYLYSKLISKFAKAGDKILDTHGGSMSSRIAADKAGFDFTGIEIDPDYFYAAEKRFDDYKLQLKLF